MLVYEHSLSGENCFRTALLILAEPKYSDQRTGEFNLCSEPLRRNRTEEPRNIKTISEKGTEFRNFELIKRA